MSDRQLGLDGLTMAQLRALATVARVGSFGAAATALGMSQPGVSRAVASVERRLGVSLLERSTRQVRLTDAGRLFIERVEAALAEVDLAADTVRAVDEAPAGGQVTMACLLSVAPAVLGGALRRLPDVQRPRRLQVLESLQDGIEEQVRSGRADLGIGDLHHLGGGLQGEPLWVEDALVCVAPGHPLARRRRLGLDALAGEELIAFPREARLRLTIDRALAEAGRLGTPRYVVQHYNTAFALVAAGFGVLVAPASAVRLAPPALACVPLHDARTRRTVGVISRLGAPPAPGLRPLLDALRTEALAIDHVRSLPSPPRA